MDIISWSGVLPALNFQALKFEPAAKLTIDSPFFETSGRLSALAPARTAVERHPWVYA